MTIPRKRPARACAALVAVNLGVLAYFLLRFSGHRIGVLPYRIDLDVYRIGSRVWLGGGNLYGPLPPTASGVRLRVFLAAAWTPARRSGEMAGWRTVGWLLPAALVLEPVRNTINYGQVNVLLMALVAADCLVPSKRWPRGALVGLAAAVKLSPAAFVLYFLLRRDWRAVRTAAFSFAAAAAVGFALAWRDSVRYWTSIVFQSSRPGTPIYAGNQSIEAILARAGLAPHSPGGLGVWLAASAVMVVLACVGMRHALDRSRDDDEGSRGWDAWALSLNAFAALLVSPISWSHHWVWGEAAMLVLACLSLREQRPAWRRTGLSLAAAGTVLFAVSPQWWFPSGDNQELHWAWWEQIAGSSYVILAVTVLLGAADVARRHTRTAAEEPARVQLVSLPR
jgi:alpha-1,2-mannosyltransferase